MIEEKIFIVFLPRHTSSVEIQRIEQAVTNVNVFMNQNANDANALSTFAPFGDGIVAKFFVKDGADLGLYCHVKIDTNNNNAANIRNEWKDYFANKLIQHGRKLCETNYPCRLFRKVRNLCPELLEETYRLHSSIKDQESENDPSDPTPFSVYECAYNALVNNFYQNKRFIETLLGIAVVSTPVSKPTSITSIASTPANNAFTNISRRDPMWATIAREERIALIIFFLFIKPDDELFLQHNKNDAQNENESSELAVALSKFKDALSDWLLEL